MSVGVISPYPEFTELVKKLARESNIPIYVKEGALNRGLFNAKKLIKEKRVNVIVARGATATFLEQHLDIPVIKITFSNYDLMKIFNEAKKQSREIVFIDHYEHTKHNDLTFIEGCLSIKIHLKEYREEREILEHIETIDGAGIFNVLVGTAQCVAKTAKGKGLKPYVVSSSPTAIKESLKRADEISKLYAKEKLHQQYLETIISHAFDGVIATNDQGEVSVYNEVASKAIGIKREDVLHRNLEKMSHPYIRKLYGTGETVTKHIISIGNKRYVVNRISLGSKSIVITFQEIMKLMDLNAEVRSYLHQRRFYAKHSFSDIVHTSDVMTNVIQIANEYSKSNSSVLINGESGVGKELFAQSIHNGSARKNGPFIAINCAALPGNLLESELFGYEEGSFTGAKKGGKSGLFEMAHNGTLFLDEIGELPLELQSRLLRVLQEKEVMRVGGQKIIPVDVRIISATNKDLYALMRKQQFREDLYYRLNVLQVKIPPLRERKEDIPELLKYLWIKNYEGNLEMEDSLKQKLLDYNWPGNIRELENVVERIHILSNTSLLDRDHFIFSDREQAVDMSFDENSVCVKIGPLKEIEKQIIMHLNSKYNGNKQKISDVLGVSRTTLWKKLSEEKVQ